MTVMTASNLRKDLYKNLNRTVEFNEIITVPLKKGAAVIMSEEDYNGLIETMYLKTMGMGNIIKRGLKTPISECISEDDIKW